MSGIEVVLASVFTGGATGIGATLIGGALTGLAQGLMAKQSAKEDRAAAAHERALKEGAYDGAAEGMRRGLGFAEDEQNAAPTDAVRADTDSYKDNKIGEFGDQRQKAGDKYNKSAAPPSQAVKKIQYNPQQKKMVYA